MPPASLKVPGKLISYDVDTRGYDEDARLPVRIIVHNVTEQKSRTIDADAIRVQAGDDCGCFDWVAAPGNRARYYVEVAIFPPGPIRGQPAKTATTAFFRGV
jgi:hypothetical protein